MGLEDKLAQGIAAAEAGRKLEARRLLTEVVQTDAAQTEGWLWLSQVVDSLEDQAVCLENVLALNPTHDFAQTRLAEVQAQQDRLFSPVYAPGQEEPPPQTTAPVEPFIIPPSLYPERDEFDNPWLCPYCAVPTQPDDKACAACHHPLIIRRRVKEERTVWLWRGIFVQFVIAFLLTFLGVGYFMLIVRLLTRITASPAALLPLYFWQKVSQPDKITAVILTFFPRWLFWGLVLFILYSVFLLFLLYFRVRGGHILYLVNAGAMMSLGLFGAIFFYYITPVIVTSVVMMMIGAAQLFVDMNLWYDFTFEQTRLRLTFDQGVKGHTSFFISGRRYSELGMWGRAIIHLRRAISIDSSHITYHLALVVAYINIKRYDLAQAALKKAEQIAPNMPEVYKLKQELAARLQPAPSKR